MILHLESSESRKPNVSGRILYTIFDVDTAPDCSWLVRRRFINVYKKKSTLVQALRLCTIRSTHRGSRGMALLFLDYATRRGEGSASRPGRTLSPGKNWYALYRRLGGPQGRSGQVRKIWASRPGRSLHPEKTRIVLAWQKASRSARMNI